MFHKIFITIFVFFSSSILHGAYCMTFPPSTSFFLEEKDNDVLKLQMIHHNGVEHAPFHQGLITGYSLELMAEKYEVAKQVGNFVNFEFKKDQCKIEENKSSCYFKEATKIGDLVIDNLYLLNYKQTTDTPFGIFKEQVYSLQYRIDGKTYETRMTYQDSDCQ